METALTIVVIALVIAGLWRLRSVSRRSRDLLTQTVDAFRLGDGQAGEEAFAQLTDELHGYRERLRAARALAGARAWPQALKVVDRTLELKPDKPALLRLRAILRARTLHPDGQRELARWVAEHPRDHDAVLTLGELYLRNGRFDDLARVLGDYLNRFPEEIRAHSLLGRGLFAARQFDRARHHLGQALALREKVSRRVVPMYDPSAVGAYDFRHAAEGQWEEEQDRLLLAQLDSGEANNTIAVFDESALEQDQDQGTTVAEKITQR